MNPWSPVVAKPARPAWCTPQAALYYGFCSPSGQVREQDLDAFERAVEAPWRRL